MSINPVILNVIQSRQDVLDSCKVGRCSLVLSRSFSLSFFHQCLGFLSGTFASDFWTKVM
jgi:hypothetical protein